MVSQDLTVQCQGGDDIGGKETRLWRGGGRGESRRVKEGVRIQAVSLNIYIFE